MIGTAYDVEQGFIDALSLKDRDIASVVLFNEKFIEMVHLYKAIDQFQLKYKVPDKHRAYFIIRAAILTKITYFDPLSLTPKKIHFICHLVGELMEYKSTNPIVFSSATASSYPVFSKWMRVAATKVNHHIKTKNVT